MKIKKFFSGVCLISLGMMTFLSCKKDKFNPITQNESSSPVAAQINLEQPTVLGKKLKNPFAIENMRAAYTELTGYRSRNPEPNKLYVRFLPKNVDERMLLEGQDLIFETVPIDIEIDSYGDFYQDPETEHLGTTWLYTTVDIGYSFKNVEYQILDSLFLTDEAEDNRTDIGVDLVLLEAKALELAGYIEEAEATLERAQKRPKGYVKYEQKIGSNTSHQPVKNLRVQSRWWFRYGNGYTNDNGYFECDKTYKHTRNVVVKVHFENQFVKIRGIKGPNFLAMFDVENNTLGTFSNNALENINYVFYDGGLQSNAKRKWVACHGINSLQEHRQYCTQNGIFVPPSTLGGLNMWITGEKREGGITFSRYAAAPMLKQMGNTSMVMNVVKMFLVASGNPLFAAALQVAIQFSPDITYNYSENNIYFTHSDQINQIFYHELAHASHYAKVGNNYWLSYIAYVVDNDGYGTPSTAGAGRIAISEAWAEYCGATFAHLRFGGLNSIPGTWQSYLEDFTPYAGTSFWQWIPEGLMHDLVDTGEPSNTGVTDNVNGYDLQKCFNAMETNVVSVSGYRIRFLNQNAPMNSTQVNAINTLFNSYGY